MMDAYGTECFACTLIWMRLNIGKKTNTDMIYKRKDMQFEENVWKNGKFASITVKMKKKKNKNTTTAPIQWCIEHLFEVF